MKSLSRKQRRRATSASPFSTRARAALCESLEDRQLLSLTVDLREFGSESKSAEATSVGQVIYLQLWATITSSNGIPAQDFVQDVGGSILSTKLGSGSINGNLWAQNVPSFHADGAVQGTVQDLNGDGNLDVGGNNPNVDPFPFFFARSASPSGSTSPSAEIVGNSLEFVIGTVVYTVTGLGKGGETDINFRPEANTANLGAVWGEDGKTLTSQYGQYLAGAPFVVTDPAIAPAPVAVPTSFYVQQNVPTAIAPLASDISGDSFNPASIIITSPATQGTVVPQDDGTFLYTSTAGFAGTDSFSYTVADIDGLTSNPATVTVTVGPTTVPVAGAVTATSPIGGSALVQVLPHDSAGAGLSLNPSTVTVLNGPLNGTAVVQQDGSILFTPNSIFQGLDSFTYTVDDSLGHVSNVGTVSMLVARSGFLNEDAITSYTSEATPADINVVSHDDSSGQTLAPGSITLTSAPTHGTAVVQPDGSFVYTPVAGFTGSDAFDYIWVDTSSTGSAEGVITVNVINGAVYPKPVATNDAATAIPGTPITINVLSNDTPSTGSQVQPNTVAIASAPAHGSVSTPGDGTIIYTPSNGFSGSDSFTYTFADSSGLISNAATVTVAVASPLKGTVIGTSGSYHNLGNTIAKVFDGSISTFFDAPTSNGNWVGLDLGKQYSLSQINFAPRAGWANRMVGGQFQASNDPSFKTGVVALGTVTTAPMVGLYTNFAVGVPGAFRYVRYLSPTASFGNVAEIQFFGTPATAAPNQLTGTVIGTAGSYQNQGNGIANVFDGNLSTFFDAPVGSGAWVGLDLGSAQSISQISFAPRTGFAYRMLGGEFQASNSANFATGVVDLYTVTSNPPSNVLTTVTVNVTGQYRYVRYVGPANACCNIAEMLFYGGA